MTTPIYRQIATLLEARANCERMGNTEWFDRHTINIDTIMASAPSGSGIDSGVTLDYDKSTPERLVFTCPFHHMNDGDYYDGWTDHVVTVRPSLTSEIDIRISGRDRNDIKSYLHDVFFVWLREQPAR